jgi:hypothetical protein
VGKQYPFERVGPLDFEVSEVAMADNRGSNGRPGAILGALIALALAVFLLNGGEHFGKKRRRPTARGLKMRD